MTAKHLTQTKAGKALLSLVVLALLALTLESLVFSDASFTATSSNGMNVFTTGSLWHDNSHAGTVVFAADYLRPGIWKEGTVTITSRGSLPGTYWLTKGAVVDSSVGGVLSQTLVLTVWVDGVQQYDGSVDAWTAPIALGAFAPDVPHQVLLRLTYPAGAGNAALDGATLTLPMTFMGSSS